MATASKVSLPPSAIGDTSHLDVMSQVGSTVDPSQFDTMSEMGDRSIQRLQLDSQSYFDGSTIADQSFLRVKDGSMANGSLINSQYVGSQQGVKSYAQSHYDIGSQYAVRPPYVTTSPYTEISNYAVVPEMRQRAAPPMQHSQHHGDAQHTVRQRSNAMDPKQLYQEQQHFIQQRLGEQPAQQYGDARVIVSPYANSSGVLEDEAMLQGGLIRPSSESMPAPPFRSHSSVTCDGCHGVGRVAGHNHASLPSYRSRITPQQSGRGSNTPNQSNLGAQTPDNLEAAQEQQKLEPIVEQKERPKSNKVAECIFVLAFVAIFVLLMIIGVFAMKGHIHWFSQYHKKPTAASVAMKSSADHRKAFKAAYHVN